MDTLLHTLYKKLTLKAKLNLMHVSEHIKTEIISTLDDHVITMKNKITSSELSECVKYFSVKKINLSFSEIDNEKIMAIKDCNEVILKWCHTLKDEHLKMLGNCNTLYLDMTHITKLDALKNVKNLSIFACFDIPRDEFIHLKNCEVLVAGCTNIPSNLSEFNFYKINLIGCYDMHDYIFPTSCTEIIY